MKRIVLFLSLLFISSTLLVAQSTVPDSVFRQVDDIVSRGAISELNAVLSKNSAAPWYPRLEAYLLKRARTQIINNKLEDAKAVSLAVIDANLDNKEAVDLYQSVQAAIKKRDSEAKKIAEQESVAAYKQKVAESKIRQELPKTYKTATNTSSGKTVYLDQDSNAHYRTWNWDFLVGLANMDFTATSDIKDFKYGLSVSGSAFYVGETWRVGLDVLGDAEPLAIAGTKSTNWSGGGIVSLGRTDISKYAVFRAGFMGFGYDYGSVDADPELFMTPVAGFGFRDMLLGDSTRFAWALDYYPGHWANSGMSAAFGTQLLATFVLAKMQDFGIHFQAGIRDTVLLYTDGVKNDAKLFLALGIGDYE
jgi:hypothetical protein